MERWQFELIMELINVQSNAGEHGGLDFNDENIYNVGMEMAAVSVLLATHKNALTPNKEDLMKDLFSRIERWTVEFNKTNQV